MGFKDYVAKKKQSFDEYRAKKEVERSQRERTRQLQEKLDRESMIQEAKSARSELQEIKKYEKAKADVAALKDYQRQKRMENSPIGKIGRGLDSFRQGIDDISAANESMFGPAPKKSADPFGSGGGMFGGMGGSGGDPFGDMFGSGKPKKRSKSKKRK